MDRYSVEKNIGKAIDSIEAVFGTDKVDKSMRSKMSAFGAAVLMGGPLSAFAYYEKNEKKISIIVPCHRVLGKNGNLTGYAAGIDMKIALLKLEGIDFKI